MTISARPEVLPPGTIIAETPGGNPGWKQRAAGSLFDDEHLDKLSHLLDDFIRVPGTPIRFGLDGIVGFIPGVGDIAGGLASTIIIVAAWFRGVPPVTIARMVANVAIETAVGSVPILGNLFDIGWRANRRNYKLLTGAIAEPKQHSAASWLFFGVLALVLVGLMLVPLVLAAWVAIHLEHWATGK